MPVTPVRGTGFDRGGIVAVQRYADDLVTNGVYPQIQTGTGRRGGNCLRFNFHSSMLLTFPEDDEISLVCALRPVAAFPSDKVLFTFLRAGNAQFTIRTAADGRLVFKLGSTTVATSTQAFSTGFFSQFQVYLKVDDSAGVLRLNWNGSATADATVDLTGIDTKGYAGAGASDAFVDGLRIGQGSSAEQFDIDDLVIVTGGSDLVGDVAVVADVASSDGSHEDLTCTTGTDMTAMINDTTPDVNDSSTISGTTGKATFNYPPLTYTPASVLAVFSKVMAKKDDAGTRTISDFLDNGTSYTGPTTELTSDYRLYDLIRTEINSAALTKTNIDAAEWGIEFL